MELDFEKVEDIENKIEELMEKIESDDLAQWESVLLDTLQWVIGEDEKPTFFY